MGEDCVPDAAGLPCAIAMPLSRMDIRNVPQAGTITFKVFILFRGDPKKECFPTGRTGSWN
jgi:hypothetical protein